MQKNEIRLSENHPSLLEKGFAEFGIYSPLIVSPDSFLIDGYRRFQMQQKDVVNAIEMDVPCLFSAAVEMNRNTRKWDEIDCFLWSRWAKFLQVENHPLARRNFPPDLNQAPDRMLFALANRRIELGQALRILQAPAGSWSFFVEFLSSNVRLNVNETAIFIEMTFDLANRWQTKNLKQVMENEKLQAVLDGAGNTSRRAGEALLKEMRNLRYPLHQQKTQELSSAWQQLNLENLQAKKGLFLDKGVLEITIRARSQEEMSKRIRELSESLTSPAWDRIWES
ncbi:hypothetical protein L0222_06830 [bacterium]|nr:hypothetical protein [bacterium]MCI0604130.1 hypothetical protein [bacterium]